MPNLHGLGGINCRDTQINIKEQQNIKASNPTLPGVAWERLQTLSEALSSAWGHIQYGLTAVVLHYQRKLYRKVSPTLYVV